MSGKKVLIVSSNWLFREGLKYILNGETDLTLTKQVSSLLEAEELVRMGQVDVVIFVLPDKEEEKESRAETIISLLSRPGIRVVVVSLNGNDLSIYRREQIEEASVEDLVAALAD